MSLASPLKLMLMASMMALFISYGYAMEENLSDDEFPYGSPIGSPPEFETCMGDEIMEEDAFAETTRVPFRAVEDDTLIIMERDKEEERKKEILRILKPFHIERMDSLKRGLIKAAAKKIANNETLEKLSSHVKKIQNILSFAFLESKNKNEDFIYDFHCSDIIEDALNLDTNELSSRMQALKQYEVTFTEDMTVQEKVDILKAVFRRRSVNEISSRLKTLKEHAGIFTKDMSQGDKSHVISAILRFDNGDDLPARLEALQNATLTLTKALHDSEQYIRGKDWALVVWRVLNFGLNKEEIERIAICIKPTAPIEEREKQKIAEILEPYIPLLTKPQNFDSDFMDLLAKEVKKLDY